MNLKLKPQYTKLKDGIWNLYVATKCHETSYEIWLVQYARGVWQWSVYSSSSARDPMRGMADNMPEAKRRAEAYLLEWLTRTDR